MIKAYAYGVAFYPCGDKNCWRPEAAQKLARKKLRADMRSRGFKIIRNSGEFALYFRPRNDQPNRWGAFCKCRVEVPAL